MENIYFFFFWQILWWKNSFFDEYFVGKNIFVNEHWFYWKKLLYYRIRDNGTIVPTKKFVEGIFLAINVNGFLNRIVVENNFCCSFSFWVLKYLILKINWDHLLNINTQNNTSLWSNIFIIYFIFQQKVLNYYVSDCFFFV